LPLVPTRTAFHAQFVDRTESNPAEFNFDDSFITPLLADAYRAILAHIDSP
jgi:hypothetical protein